MTETVPLFDRLLDALDKLEAVVPVVGEMEASADAVGASVALDTVVEAVHNALADMALDRLRAERARPPDAVATPGS